MLSAQRTPCPSLPSDWEGEGRGGGGASHPVQPHGSAPSFFSSPPSLSPHSPHSLSLSLRAASSSLHPPVDRRRRNAAAYLQDGAVRSPSKVPVSPSEAAQVQGVDGHVGGGLPCRAGAVAGPGVLVDDHLRRELGGAGKRVFHGPPPPPHTKTSRNGSDGLDEG